MKDFQPNQDLARLAALLSTWVEGERAEHCQKWAAYWSGEGEKPGNGKGVGTPRKDSDFHVYIEALACVTFGWSGRALQHIERVQRRMRATTVLDKFPLAARVGVPQAWDGKE